MAQRRPTDSGLPRRVPGQALDDANPAQAHDHGGESHIHRMGLLPHRHGEDARPVFEADAKMVPAATDDQTLVQGNADVLATAPVSLGADGEAADPTPDPAGGLPAPVAQPPAPAVNVPAANQGGGGVAGSGRPSPGRSIGRVIANSAMDAALGVPADLQDERAHAREAAELLIEAAADHHRHNRLMPAGRLLDLEAVVAHMVRARGLR